MQTINRGIETITTRYPDLKWVKPHAMHITALFLGNLNQEQQKRCINILKDPAFERKPFRVHYAGGGQFPPRGKPRVLFCKIHAGFSECVELYQVLKNRAAEVIEVEDRKYSPHITLARVKKRVPVPPLEEFDHLEGDFTVDRCVLYESILRPTGAEYRTVAEATFE